MLFYYCVYIILFFAVSIESKKKKDSHVTITVNNLYFKGIRKPKGRDPKEK